MGFGEVLTVVFIVLKLTSCIDWSWIWVLSPLWISVPLELVVVFGALFWGNKR